MTPACLRSHSHTTPTRHRRARSATIFRASRTRVAEIFSVQNSLLDVGSLPAWQLWPCQKQPLTNMTAHREGKTRSGLPGRSRRCTLYRYPRACSALRRNSSGFVSFDLTAAIMRLRVLGQTISIVLHYPIQRRGALFNRKAGRDATGGAQRASLAEAAAGWRALRGMSRAHLAHDKIGRSALTLKNEDAPTHAPWLNQPGCGDITAGHSGRHGSVL